MTVNIARQERAYRRGLVLGFTVAEIFVLIVFALLLTFAAYLLRREDEVTHLREALAQTPQMERVVETLLRAVEADPALHEAVERAVRGEEEAFDDLFRELTLAVTAKDAQEELQALRERLVEAEADRDAAAERVDAFNDIAAATGLADRSPEEVARQVADMIEELEELRRTADNLRGELQHLQARYGSEHPPCWFRVDPETGRRTIDYIFNVVLSPGGLVIFDNEIPHWAEQQAQLPGITRIEFQRVLSEPDFLTQTRPLFEWSREQEPECRFYVRVYDRTGDDKALYIRRLRAVESHFYKLMLRS